MNFLTPLVILAPRMTDDSKAIWKTCIDLGWPSERIQGWRVPQHLVSSGQPVLIYGEPLFAESVADQIGLILLEPSIDWLTTIPHKYLHRQIELITLGEARSATVSAFVKPADGKIFEPKVYQSGAELPTDEHVDQDISVLRSGIVDFRLEVRCFVSNHKVVTLSPYWRNDQIAYDENTQWPFLVGEEDAARCFAQTVLDDQRIELPPACTLDIGRIENGAWAIIEANPCWGAGLYGCDPEAVLHAIKHAIIRRDEVTEAHLQWISRRRTTIHS